MNRLIQLPCFEISNNEEIEFFIGIFLHIWKDLAKVGSDIAEIQEQVDNYIAAGELDKAKEKSRELSQWMEFQPHEEKSATILRNMLKRILEHCSGRQAIYVYYAEHYNDRYYRDIHSMHYSAKHFSLPNMCSRFFLFDAEKLDIMEDRLINERDTDVNYAFIGSIVRRPLVGREIGRTLIDPKYFYKSNILCELKSNIWRNKYKMTMYGIPLEVWAFPYTMQDGEVSTCTETTIMNIIDYYSQRYSEYRVVLPSEISEIVRKNCNDRNLPSKGLSYEMVSKVFMELGFSPMLYSAKNYKSRFAHLLHSYVASGFPVALGIDDDSNTTSGHSVIVIGTQNRLIDASIKDRIEAFDSSPVLRLPDRKQDVTHYQVLKGAFDNRYIIMDDGREPYSCAEIYERDGMVYLRYLNEEKEWKVSIFVVPMSAEMLMDAESAINCFRGILKNRVLGYSCYLQNLELEDENEKEALEAGLDINKPLLTRIFLCPSKRLKEQRIRKYEEAGSWESLDEFQGVHLPRYVWVCELFTRATYTGEVAQCVGEIILDATNAPSSDNDTADIIWIKYPWKHAYRRPNQSLKDLENQMRQEEDKKSKWTAIEPFRFELH